MTYKYVWLNIKTGEFSNSWDYENMHWPASCSPEELAKDADPKWKLIKYQCLTDSNFEFLTLMKLR